LSGTERGVVEVPGVEVRHAASTDLPRGAPDGGAAPAGRDLEHHRALDGLRGFAVVLVLCFHGAFSWAKGGFLGVSLFFTLSGFLITRLLLADHRVYGRIRFAAFWEKRARRLVPAALLATALVIVVAPYLWNDSQRASMPGDVLSAVTYTTNWHALATGNSYGALFATPSPLEHFWSLAIEEQFYLVMPLLVAVVLGLGRGSRRIMAIVLTACAGASFFLMLHAGSIDRAYYGTDTRAFEVLVGALLAVAYPVDRRPSSRANGWSGWSLAGVVALVFTIFMAASMTFSTSWLYNGGLALFAFSSVILVRACMVPGPIRRIFSTRVLCALGLISYGIYLFHWPVFMVLSQQRVGLSPVPLFTLRVAVTLLIALASYHFVERPIRQRRALRSWRLPAVLLSIAALLALVGSFVVPNHAVGVSADAARAVSQLPRDEAPQPTGTTVPGTVPKPLRIYVAGDSIGLFFATGLQAWGEQHPGTIVVYANTNIRCPITRGGLMSFEGEETSTADCDKDLARWPSDLQNFAPDVVIVATGPTNTVDRKIAGDSKWRAPGDPVLDAFQLSEMKHDVDVLHATGAPVLWLDMPYEQRDGGEVTGRAVLASSDRARIDRYNQLLDELAASRPVSILRWGQYFNSLSIEDDLAIRGDGVHLGTEGTEQVMDKFLWQDIQDGYLAGKATGSDASTSSGG
jgi:peptidoglycan/LPS O-acetylase OafA/YrhL